MRPPARKAGFWARRFSKILMGAMCRPVFGWRGDDPADTVQVAHVGIDGSRLVGAVRESNAARVKGVVILFHPFLKFGMHYFFKNQYHEWLSQAGYHVVAFNFKGFGRSTVEGLTFADDVISVGQWTRERYPDLPVHVLGISFGAFQCIHAIATRRVAFDSVLFESPPATLSHLFGSGVIGAAIRCMSRSRWAVVTGTREILGSLPLPAELPRLLLYGERDAYIMPDELERVRQACGPAHVRVFPGCGHLGIRKAFADEYIAAVIGFFDAHGARQGSTADAGARIHLLSSKGR